MKIDLFLLAQTFIFIGITFVVIGTGLFLFGTFADGDIIETSQVDCFDRYGNRINDVTCTEEITQSNDYELWGGVLIIIGLTIAMLALLSFAGAVTGQMNRGL